MAEWPEIETFHKENIVTAKTIYKGKQYAEIIKLGRGISPQDGIEEAKRALNQSIHESSTGHGAAPPDR